MKHFNEGQKILGDQKSKSILDNAAATMTNHLIQNFHFSKNE